MARPHNMKNFATKKELDKLKRSIHREIKKEIKGLKSWDVKQDRKLLKRKKK